MWYARNNKRNITSSNVVVINTINININPHQDVK